MNEGAIAWKRGSVGDGLIPPQIPEWGWIVGLAGGIVTFAKILSEWATARTTRAKLDAERRAAEALRRKSEVERETQMVLGEKAYDELQGLRLTDTMAWLKETRLLLDELRSELANEREQGRRFRGAVLEFLAVLESVVPELPSPQRSRIQDALTTLRHHDGWER